MGYGDIPLNQGGTHIFVEVYTFFSTILLAFAIANLTTIQKEKKYLQKALAVAERKQTLDQLKLLDTGKGVPRDTFILAVLERLGVINHDLDIEPWLQVHTSPVLFPNDYLHLLPSMIYMTGWQKFAEYDLKNSGILHRHVSCFHSVFVLRCI